MSGIFLQSRKVAFFNTGSGGLCSQENICEIKERSKDTGHMFNKTYVYVMQLLKKSLPSFNSAKTFKVPSTKSMSVLEKRLVAIGVFLLALAIMGTLLGSTLAELLNLQLNAHGHAHFHAHGHPFIDARTLWGIPNALDVLSNLAFIPLGLWGLKSLYQAPMVHRAAQQSAAVFFLGLLATCASSSYYHWAPSAWGLAMDRAGMAMAFSGVLGLTAAERVSLRAAPYVWVSVLGAGLIAAYFNYSLGAIAPWAVVQFGGIAVVLWAATQPKQAGALGVRWGWLIGIYAVAKLFELGDEVVYRATDHTLSGHSIKHIVASMAALPIISALRHNANHRAKA